MSGDLDLVAKDLEWCGERGDREKQKSTPALALPTTQQRSVLISAQLN